MWGQLLGSSVWGRIEDESEDRCGDSIGHKCGDGCEDGSEDRCGDSIGHKCGDGCEDGSEDRCGDSIGDKCGDGCERRVQGTESGDVSGWKAERDIVADEVRPIGAERQTALQEWSGETETEGTSRGK